MDDRYAIERLKYRYFRTLDLKQWDAFADCLTADATANYAGLTFANRAALVAYMCDNLGAGLITTHTAHHPEIEVSGDEATGTWYLEDRVLVPELAFALQGAAFYTDRYTRTEEGWRIQHTGYERTFEMSWSTDDMPSLRIKKGAMYGESPHGD